MIKLKDASKEKKQEIEYLFKEHCSYLDLNIFSEEPYIQFPDGTVVYLEGVEE